MKEFHYQHHGDVRDYYPTSLSIRQFDRCRLGLCQDAVTYFVNAFRSVGLVCSNEYVPQFGNHHYKGHSWIYIRYGDEEFALDAGGDGVDIRQKYIGESVPKVYRRTYAQDNPSSLFREGRDVTDFYRPVIDFEVEAGGAVPDTSVIYTVNVFHGTKGWTPVAEMVPISKGRESGRPDHSSKLICHDLGVNTLYIVGRWDDGKVYPVTSPFFVNEKGVIHEFKPEITLLDSAWTGGIDFYVGYEFKKPVRIRSIAFQARNDDNHIRMGDEYELHYWDREWKSLGKQVAQDTVLYFSDVPNNALMLLKDLTRGSEEFPFRINEDKEQEWMGFDNY